MAATFDALLEVQDHDTRLDQIRHRIESLPERAQVAAGAQRLGELDDAIEAESATREEIVRDQRRLEDEIESIGEKRKQVEATLYSGAVSNARELQDLQEESEALGRRITHLEDRDLELMEKLEPVDAELEVLNRTRTAEQERLDAAGVRLTTAEAELQVELDRVSAERDEVVQQVPAELLNQYEKLRSGLGGVGVARLVGSQCGGCHLTLSAMEVARIRKNPDEITNCEECGRLLVV
jgi:predicted  nucleic acid-binding Zn-ribbon protein